jgi:hypothetical protein
MGWLFETKSVTQAQRNYSTQFNKQPQSDYAIRDWQRRYLETGSVHDRKRSGRPGVNNELWKQSVHRLYEALQNPHVELRVNCYSHVQRYRMWLTQFVCAPQFFKTPSGHCGHCIINNISKSVLVFYLLP